MSTFIYVLAGVGLLFLISNFLLWLYMIYVVFMKD